MTQTTNSLLPDREALRKELTSKASALVPLLRANADKAERERRIPDESLSALEEAGLFRICAPAKFGGYEGDIRTYMDANTEIGRGCGSTAWVAFISNLVSWMVGYYPEETQQEIFGENVSAKFIGVLAPTATTKLVDGGYRVTGAWGFSSGSLHADWALAAAPLEQSDGSAIPGAILFPMSESKIEDTWFAAGMKASGSNTVIVEDIFVPHRRVKPLAELMSRNAIGDTERGVTYGQAYAVTSMIAVAAPVLGLAKAAVELTRDRMNAGGKRISYSNYADTRDSAAMRMQMAEAASLISVGENIVKGWCDTIVERSEQGRELTKLDRVQLRTELGLAMKHCRDGVDLLMSVQGASAFMDANPIQRIWRDLEVGTRHGMLSPEVPAEIYGRMLFDDEGATDLSIFI